MSLGSTQIWEEAKQTYEYLGIDTAPKTTEGAMAFAEELEWEYHGVLAEYISPRKKILILPENLSMVQNMNEAVLTLILGHELMHHCQYTNNPYFNEREKILIKKLYGSNLFDKKKPNNKKVEKYCLTHQCLSEGDAKYVEKQLAERFYPLGKKAIGKFSLCCQEDMEVIEEVHKTQGRRGVNDLYSLDIRDLCAVFQDV